MSEIETTLARLRKLTELRAKWILIDKLRDKAIQMAHDVQSRCEEHSGRASENEAMAIVDRRVASFQKIGESLASAESTLRGIDERIPEIEKRINDTDESVDRFIDRSLRSLERLQSIFELEIFELADVIAEFDQMTKTQRPS